MRTISGRVESAFLDYRCVAIGVGAVGSEILAPPLRVASDQTASLLHPRTNDGKKWRWRVSIKNEDDHWTSAIGVFSFASKIQGNERMERPSMCASLIDTERKKGISARKYVHKIRLMTELSSWKNIPVRTAICICTQRKKIDYEPRRGAKIVVAGKKWIKLMRKLFVFFFRSQKNTSWRISRTNLQ